MKQIRRNKIYPERISSPFDGLPLQEKLARKVAIWFVFAGVFFWFIKLMFL
jgi:hypothetical protein